jgi:hypothetical protein
VIDNDPIGTAGRTIKRLYESGGCPPVCLICCYVSEVAVKPRRLSREQAKPILKVLVSERGIQDSILKMLLENDHVYGRNHDPEFIVPLCRNCHAEVTEDRLRAGISMRPESNPIARVVLMLESETLFFERLLPARRRLLDELRRALEPSKD